MTRLLLVCLLVAVLATGSSVVDAAEKKKKSKKVVRETEKVEEVHTGPIDECVWDRGGKPGALVSDTPRTRHVLEHHGAYHKDTHVKHFGGAALAYVTPWNGKGYDVAKEFRCKFTHVSPVWFQLKLKDGKNDLVVEGAHDVDAGWVQELRKPCGEGGGSPPRVLPRFLSELPPRELLNFLAFPRSIIEPVLAEVKRHGLDGLVLECWTQWAAMGLFREPAYRKLALAFVRKMGEATREAGLTFVLAAPPAVSPHEGGLVFSAEDFQEVRDDVDGVSLMTYDFSHAEAPGPNAPLDWMRRNLQELLGEPGSDDALKWGPRVWLGLNLYGREFAPAGGMGALAESNAVVGGQYLELLQKHRPKLQWEGRAGEHYLNYKRQAAAPNEDKEIVATLWYPTLKSLHARLELAREYGAGISAWEVGQGLDYMYDLL